LRAQGEVGQVFFLIQAGAVICRNMGGDQANNVLHAGEEGEEAGQ
jgi:hypothetical protein